MGQFVPVFDCLERILADFTEPFQILMIEMHDKGPVRGEVMADTGQTGDLIFCCVDILEGVSGNKRQTEPSIQREITHVGLHPAHIGHSCAF